MKKPKIRVRIIANKIDLLPKDASMPRVKGWIAREAQLAGLDKIKIMDVFPISCGPAGYSCSRTFTHYLGSVEDTLGQIMRFSTTWTWDTCSMA